MALAGPAVAVTWADPLPAAVTTPVDETLATFGSLLVQEIAASVIAFPCWSVIVGESCWVWPMASNESDGGSRVMSAGPLGSVPPPPHPASTARAHSSPVYPADALGQSHSIVNSGHKNRGKNVTAGWWIV